MAKVDPLPLIPNFPRDPLKRLSRLALLVGAAWAISACTPATLKQRNGYWADQAQTAQAFNHRVRFLVLHYTGGDEARAIKVLTGPSVSSHYVVADQPPRRGAARLARLG